MDLMYGVHKKLTLLNQSNNTDQQNFKYLCTVSTSNLIAFTTPNEVSDPSNNTFGFHVHIADINCPWLCYKVTSNKYPVSVLEWDVSSKYLLVGDTVGSVTLWSQKDFMISEWTAVHTVKFPGENILKAAFFHNGRKIIIHPDKRDSPLYLEKFKNIKFAPSVRQFGGVPTEGFMVITSTGMLGAYAIPTEVSSDAQNTDVIPETVATESLGLTRNFYTMADVSYSKNGQFLIAVANNETKNSSIIIQCYRVSIKKIDEKLVISSHSIPSFFVGESIGRGMKDFQLAHLKWISREDADSLIIGINHFSESFTELWTLTEEMKSIHKMLQSSKNECYKTIVWKNHLHYRYGAKVLKMCTTKLQLNSAYIYLAMSDNSIHCLTRDGLKRITSAIFFPSRSDSNEHAKQMRLDTKIAAFDLTYMGHLLCAIDTSGEMYVYKQNFIYQDQFGNTPFLINVVNYLEYCLTNGLDAIDILLTLKVQILDNIIDKLNDNFSRQPPSVQQFFYVNFLTMKINIYRLSQSGQSKAHDLTCLLMLHSILIAFKSLLRPSDLSHEKGPAENLAMVLAESVPDVDKVLLNLEAKDFTVEPSTLQSLQQLIQWVADLALNILARLPENRCFIGGQKSVGYEISKDIVALNSIRELLVMIRIWGLLKPQCLPIFSRSADNLDVLLQLFRLLTKLALNPNDPDDSLLDDCCLLPSQVLIPHIQFSSSRTTVSSPATQYLSLPLHFEYNVEYELLKYNLDISTVEGGLTGGNVIDSIRYLQLGKTPAVLRRCLRCGACSSLTSVARTPAMKAWEQRWVRKCRCGGYWRLDSTLASVS